MTPSEKRYELAQLAYNKASNKEAVEKTVYVDEKTFNYCISDMNDHHKSCISNKGYIRTYHEPFWTKNPGGLGRTYHHGVIHIVNKDAEINQIYVLDCSELSNFKQQLSEALSIKRHRLIDIYIDPAGDICAILTPQRMNFDN